MTNTETEKMEDLPLNPEQIQHWRTMLASIIGPYALLMPVADIETFRKNLQRAINEDATEG